MIMRCGCSKELERCLQHRPHPMGCEYIHEGIFGNSMDVFGEVGGLRWWSRDGHVMVISTMACSSHRGLKDVSWNNLRFKDYLGYTEGPSSSTTLCSGEMNSSIIILLKSAGYYHGIPASNSQDSNLWQTAVYYFKREDERWVLYKFHKRETHIKIIVFQHYFLQLQTATPFCLHF